MISLFYSLLFFVALASAQNQTQTQTTVSKTT